MGKILPVLMALIGVGAGVGAGIMLKPAPDETTEIATDSDDGHAETSKEADAHGEDGGGTTEYVKMHNQFVIPVVEDGKVVALVVLSLSIEVIAGGKEATFQMEPKLRDAFNQVLFDHANAGGFMGVFTNSSNMVVLHDSLYEIARKTAGPVVVGVLIADIIRQDV